MNRAAAGDPMLKCPSCSNTISGRDFAHRSSFKPYRLCPFCDTRITVDSRTKRRQFIALMIGLVALVTTIGAALYEVWLAASLTSCAVLGAYIWWANRYVQLVNYRQSTDGT